MLSFQTVPRIVTQTGVDVSENPRALWRLARDDEMWRGVVWGVLWLELEEWQIVLPFDGPDFGRLFFDRLATHSFSMDQSLDSVETHFWALWVKFVLVDFSSGPSATWRYENYFPHWPPPGPPLQSFADYLRESISCAQESSWWLKGLPRNLPVAFSLKHHGVSILKSFIPIL